MEPYASQIGQWMVTLFFFVRRLLPRLFICLHVKNKRRRRRRREKKKLQQQQQHRYLVVWENKELCFFLFSCRVVAADSLSLFREWRPKKRNWNGNDKYTLEFLLFCCYFLLYSNEFDLDLSLQFQYRTRIYLGAGTFIFFSIEHCWCDTVDTGFSIGPFTFSGHNTRVPSDDNGRWSITT